VNEVNQLHQKVAELQAENDRLVIAYQQSDEWFRRVFHASSNMMAIHTLKERRFVDVNEAAASMGGFKREELIGHTLEERGLLVDPESKKRVDQKLREEGNAHNLELKVRTKDGDMRTVLAFTDPITINNEPCLLTVSVDITDQEESREYLDQIINCIGDPIFVKDREHRFVLVNDSMCALMGKTRAEVIGHIDRRIANSPDSSAFAFWDQEEEVFTTGKEILSEDMFYDEHGNHRTFMTKKSLLTDKKANRQVVGVLRDITEYKRLESQFLQSQKMEAIGVLAGGVAHDFNNLLNVINGYAELILEELDPENSLRKDVKAIQDAGLRAAALTSQLLAFGRKQIMQPEIFDLNQVIARMSAMLRRMIGEDIEIVSKTQPEPILINADPVKMQQVILNLIVNARDAMPNGGTLEIETAKVDFDDGYIKDHPINKPGPYVLLAISDNGVGMDAATQARIFEPFFSTKPKEKGTGLGLSTVYGIIKQSNGFIYVYSEPGKGTTVKVYFPRESGPVAAIHQETRLDSELRGSETVLVVEDETAVRSLICRVLRDRAYNVLEAADGMEAIRLSQDYGKEIHLVITDVVMPGLGGRLLVSSLQEARPGIRSLFISGYTDNAVVHRGILDSEVAFLQKPFSIDSLLRKVRKVLDA
jgi:PAS domain S-box-containing protein